MDRRFLSQTEVIAASRKFVCVRLMTYESASEAQLLKSLWIPGRELENTLFAILDSSGRPITRGARSPDFFFRSAPEMAASLDDIARNYQSGFSRTHTGSLPTVRSIRLGMDVAACDKLPLAIVLGDDDIDRKPLESKLASVAWSDAFIGESIYTSGRRADLSGINGVSISKGYLFVLPNQFGTSARVVAQLSPDASTAELASSLKQTLSFHHPVQMDHREHIRMGREQGIHWNTAIPVTDPHELQAERSGPPRGFRSGSPDFGPPGFEQ